MWFDQKKLISFSVSRKSHIFLVGLCYVTIRSPEKYIFRISIHTVDLSIPFSAESEWEKFHADRIIFDFRTDQLRFEPIHRNMTIELSEIKKWTEEKVRDWSMEITSFLWFTPMCFPCMCKRRFQQFLRSFWGLGTHIRVNRGAEIFFINNFPLL